MDWIQDLFGPKFLLFYLLFGGGLFALVFYANRRSEAKSALSSKSLPDLRDPYRVAYLRGGENELIRLAVFRLIQRGLLTVLEPGDPRIPANSKDKKAAHLHHAPGTASLNENDTLEMAILDAVSRPTPAKALFKFAPLTATAARTGAQLQEALEAEGLLTTRDERALSAGRAFAGLALTLSLGLFKLFAAIESEHYNIGFLIALSIVFTLLFGTQMVGRRLTQRGKACLDALTDRYESLKSVTLLERSEPEVCLFSVALFGMPVLVGTPYQTVPELFPRASSNSATSGCGGSCGSGCGGGGGSCGGGGCGGCGGG